MLLNWWLLLSCCCCCYPAVVWASLAEESIVKDWATNIGLELYQLASAVAQPDDLLLRYKKIPVVVEHKSGEEIIRTISENVGRMLSRKMDAVKCLYKKAEVVSEEWVDIASDNLTYHSAKYSDVMVENKLYQPNIPENMQETANETYIQMDLEPDTHFNNIAVNVSYSSVHLPTNVFDKLPRVSNTIFWSKKLDRIFKHNYRADPALMWQYFCSTTGVLRQYPSMRWPRGLKADGVEITDIYDCRVRSWFIEASTCSKDMVILVDNSGSMTGMSNTIAKATVATILSTLSNNDFVAVFNYSDTTEQVVPCFKDKLIQATPENIKKFNMDIATMKPEGYANLTEAFLAAFSLLETYRNSSRCGEGMSCNQLIMLITDGIASNITEVFEEWNWFDEHTIPVRVFTYLLGQEVTGVREIQYMACLNRGYYTHIHTQAEVREQVLKYIPVVARPLVLHRKVHPVVWTHAYVDISRIPDSAPIAKDPKFVDDGVDITDMDEEEEDKILAENSKGNLDITWRERLLTSVSIPVFDHKITNESFGPAANLLGVVGTDVPLEDIRKLTLPYKLGVNGYAFIVSNNGYVVLHPALKPAYRGELKLNFNSIDLTEVEILDDDRPPRDPGEDIIEIRNKIVNGECGKKLSVKVKLHYDNYRRVTLESRDYYWAPLPLTPFGIAVVLPQYGRYYVKVNRQIESHRDRNISHYFMGENWAIHPQWVYCRYHYLEGHEFDTPENELRHFLKIIGNFSKSEAERYPPQYKAYDESHATSYATNCRQKTAEEWEHFKPEDHEPDCGSDDLTEEQEDYDRHRNDHYCNKELMELLVMDAFATNDSFTGEFGTSNATHRKLIRDYDVFLRFVATQSGLTRWQRVEGSKIKDIERRIDEFAQMKRALDEPWYKGAILQHEIDPDSISITVPPKLKQRHNDEDATVTISTGVYARDASREAATGVVGLQLPMRTLRRQFMRVVSQKVIDGFTCMSNAIDCYLIDQNGYIIISEAEEYDAGKFFGSLGQTAAIMRSLVKQNLFQAVEIYDYLAVCYETKLESAASILKNPFVSTWNFITWIFARLLIFASQIQDLPMIFAQEEEEVDFSKPPKMHKIRFSKPCDMKMILHIVNQTRFDDLFTNQPDECTQPFYAKRLEKTNLLLVVVKTDQPACNERMDVLPTEIYPYTDAEGNITEFPCHKIPLNNLFRRRLKDCFTQHEDEYKIDVCGGSSRLAVSLFLISIGILRSLIMFF